MKAEIRTSIDYNNFMSKERMSRVKIRKANVKNENSYITNVYIYENKKEEYSLIAVPEIEWSTTISYEEKRDELYDRLVASLVKNVEQETADELARKVKQWVSEM